MIKVNVERIDGRTNITIDDFKCKGMYDIYYIISKRINNNIYVEDSCVLVLGEWSHVGKYRLSGIRRENYRTLEKLIKNVYEEVDDFNKKILAKDFKKYEFNLGEK